MAFCLSQYILLFLLFGLIADCISVQQAFKFSLRWTQTPPERPALNQLTDLFSTNPILQKPVQLIFPTNLISNCSADYVTGPSTLYIATKYSWMQTKHENCLNQLQKVT